MGRAGLRVLDAEVDHRVAEVRAQTGDWPCKSGCSACCRSLAGPLLLSGDEWDRLIRALVDMPADLRGLIRAELDAMEETVARGDKLSCPFLEDETSRCRVYEARPLVCRTYGYYGTRDGGFWCEDIEARVEGGGAEGVIFGRHEAIFRTAARKLGPPLPWPEWRDAPRDDD